MILKHAGERVAAGRHTLGAGIAVAKTQTLLRQGVYIRGVDPWLCFRIATDCPDALVVGENIEDVWLIRKGDEVGEEQRKQDLTIVHHSIWVKERSSLYVLSMPMANAFR